MNEQQVPSAGTAKAAAVDFLQLVAAGRVREAYDRHVGADFRHHNPFFPGDAEALRVAMEENAAKFPGKVLEVQRALQEGDLVAVHSRVQLQPGAAGIALVHIFRFHDGRIAELWDIGQVVPEPCSNTYGMF